MENHSPAVTNLLPLLKKESLGTDFLQMNLLKPEGFFFESGQYCILSLPEKEAPKTFLAIASHHSEKELVFIIDKKHSQASSLIDAERLAVSQPQGKGFPMSQRAGKHLVIITHGSGFSAVRPAIIDFVRQPDHFKSLQFFYGTKNKDNLPFLTDLPYWQNLARIHLAFSQEHPFQRIQPLLSQAEFDRDSIFLIVGSKEMSSEVKQIIIGKGFSAETILFNY